MRAGQVASNPVQFYSWAVLAPGVLANVWPSGGAQAASKHCSLTGEEESLVPQGGCLDLSCFPSSTNVLLLIVNIPVYADQYNQSVQQTPQVLNDALKSIEDTVTANAFGFHLG